MSIKPSQLKITNDRLVIGKTKNSVDHVGVGLAAHVDSDLTFSVDSTGTEGIKFLLRADSVTATEIATSAVGSDEIAEGAVGASEIEDGSISTTELNIASQAWSFAGASSFIVPAPTADGHAATKLYVDSNAQGLDFKDSCVVATTANIAGSYSSGVFTVTATGAPTIDGVTLEATERVLFKDQTTGSQNGVYTCTTVGGVSTSSVYTRAVDFDADSEVTAGAYVLVTEGTTNILNAYVLNKASGGGDPTLDTDALTFSLFSGSARNYTGGDGIEVTGTSVAVDLATEGALEIDGNAQVAINLEASNPTLQISSTELMVKIGNTTNSYATLASNTAGLEVKVDGETVKVGSSGLTAAVLSRSDYDAPTASVTGTSAGSTGVTVDVKPANGTDVLVFINGVMASVGDSGDYATSDVFFLANGETTTSNARDFDDLIATDVLWFNPGIAGFDIETSDEVKIVFQA